MRTMLLAASILISVFFSCVQSKEVSLQQDLNQNKIPTDTIKELIEYDYPNKWQFDIGEVPAYKSLQDSLADDNLSKLSYLSDSVYNQATIGKQRPLSNFDDSELRTIYNELLPNQFFVRGNYKWDIPYFVRTLEDNDSYTINLYKNGAAYDQYWDYLSTYNFFVVHYLVLEIVNKNNTETEHYISYVVDNNNIEHFMRYFSIEKNTLTLADFYFEEIERTFLGKNHILFKLEL